MKRARTPLEAEHEVSAMATDVRTRQTSLGVPPKRSRPTWPARIAAALPGVFLAVVFGFFFITKTSEAWTATKSARALLVIGGIVVGWVVVRGCCGGSCAGFGFARRSCPRSRW